MRGRWQRTVSEYVQMEQFPTRTEHQEGSRRRRGEAWEEDGEAVCREPVRLGRERDPPPLSKIKIGDATLDSARI